MALFMVLTAQLSFIYAEDETADEDISILLRDLDCEDLQIDELYSYHRVSGGGGSIAERKNLQERSESCYCAFGLSL